VSSFVFVTKELPKHISRQEWIPSIHPVVNLFGLLELKFLVVCVTGVVVYCLWMCDAFCEKTYDFAWGSQEEIHCWKMTRMMARAPCHVCWVVSLVQTWNEGHPETRFLQVMMAMLQRTRMGPNHMRWSFLDCILEHRLTAVYSSILTYP
jgi:hypothetical protein